MIDINDLNKLNVCESCKCVFMPNDRECYLKQLYCRNCGSLKEL